MFFFSNLNVCILCVPVSVHFMRVHFVCVCILCASVSVVCLDVFVFCVRVCVFVVYFFARALCVVLLIVSPSVGMLFFPVLSEQTLSSGLVVFDDGCSLSLVCGWACE